VLGVLWVNWRTGQSLTRELPRDELKPDIDSSALAVDVNGDLAIAVSGAYSAYRPDEEQLWLVRQTETNPPQLVHHSRKSGLVFSLSPDRTHLLVGDSISEQPRLEMFALAPFVATVRIPVTSGAKLYAVALSNDLQHVAIATEHRVVCVGRDGKELCAWPNEPKLHFLSFAEDGLSLWGISKDAVTHFPWKGAQVPFTIFGGRPWAFDTGTQRAVFLAPAGICEVNLSNGEVLVLGGGIRANAPFVDCCDVGRRRTAILDYDGPSARIRVFEATS